MDIKVRTNISSEYQNIEVCINAPERNEQVEEAALKTQILTLLEKAPLSNQEIRQITGKTAQQVRKLMAEMENDGVALTGKGRGSKYVLGK